MIPDTLEEATSAGWLAAVLGEAVTAVHGDPHVGNLFLDGAGRPSRYHGTSCQSTKQPPRLGAHRPRSRERQSCSAALVMSSSIHHAGALSRMFEMFE
jgi:hypothetical protein